MRPGKGHMLPRTGTMQSSRLPSGALLCALLLLSSDAVGAQLVDAESEEELSPRALRDFYPKGPNLTSEKQLVSLDLSLGPARKNKTTLTVFSTMFPFLTYIALKRQKKFLHNIVTDVLYLCPHTCFTPYPESLELSKKFWKSCRRSDCLRGKRNLAKSRR